MLNTRYKSVLMRWFQPLAAGLARTGVSPSALTLAGLVLSALTCLWFVWTRAVLPFCAAITVLGLMDSVDGAVARASGRVTKFGGYLDAVCDRYFEIMGVLAAAVVTGYWFWSFMAIAGALLVSYTKARAAMEVPISNLEWPDLMERGERDVLFVVGLAASVLVAWTPLGHDLFWWTLVALSVLNHLTAAQRILRAKRLIQSRA